MRRVEFVGKVPTGSMRWVDYSRNRISASAQEDGLVVTRQSIGRTLFANDPEPTGDAETQSGQVAIRQKSMSQCSRQYFLNQTV